MKTIQPLVALFGRLRDGENFEVHKIILNYLKTVIATLPSVATMFASYEAKFQYLDTVFKQYKKYIESEKIAEADRARKDEYLSIKRSVEGAEYSRLPDIQEAGQYLAFIINNYKGVNMKPYADATGIYFNMIQDFRSDEYLPYTERLQLGAAIDELEKFNNQFETFYSRRSDKKELRRLLGSLRTARRETDLVLRDIAEAVNALYRVNEIGPRDPAQKTLLDGVMNHLNGYITQAKKDYFRHVEPKKPKDPVPEPETPDTAPYELKAGSQTIPDGTHMRITDSNPEEFAKRFTGKLEGSFLLMKNDATGYDVTLDFSDYAKDENEAVTGIIYSPPGDKFFVEDYADQPLEEAYIEKGGEKLIILSGVKGPLLPE